MDPHDKAVIHDLNQNEAHSCQAKFLQYYLCLAHSCIFCIVFRILHFCLSAQTNCALSCGIVHQHHSRKPRSFHFRSISGGSSSKLQLLDYRGAFVPRPPAASSNGRGVDRLGSLPMPPTSYAPSLPRLQIPPTPVPSALPLPAGLSTPPHITYFNAPEHPPRRSDLAVQIAWTEAVNRLMSPDGPEVRPFLHDWFALKVAFINIIKLHMNVKGSEWYCLM